jgi:hypothetical protein
VRVDAELFDGQTPYLKLRWVWLAFQCLVAGACLAYVKRERASPSFIECTSEQGPRRSRLGRSAIVALSLLVSSAFVVASPALVEWRKGSAARTLLAVSDLFAPKPRWREADPLARFRGTDPERAAVAYFLAYYGDARRAAELPEAPAAGLEGAARLLRERLSLETRSYDWRPRLPRIAALAELKDGSLGVVGSPGDGAAWLFRAKDGHLLEGEPERIRALLGPGCLLPVSPR